MSQESMKGDGIMAGNGYNLNGIGNVGLYASNLVRTYMNSVKPGSGIGKADNSFASVKSTTVRNNAAFTSQNVSNLQMLKAAASALNSTARGLGSYATESELVAAAQNFASAYNKTISHLTSGTADGAGVEKALNLVADNRMTGLSMGNYGSYTANRAAVMGVSIDQDGKMQVDAKKLTDAAQKSPASVKSILTGRGSIPEIVHENAEQAMRIPAATYTDFSKMQVSDSLIDALLPNSGFLFDFAV